MFGKNDDMWQGSFRDYINTLTEKYLRQLEEKEAEIERLKKMIPYPQYLKSLSPFVLRSIAINEYGIPEGMVAQMCDKADIIMQILQVKKDLENIK